MSYGSGKQNELTLLLNKLLCILYSLCNIISKNTHFNQPLNSGECQKPWPDLFNVFGVLHFAFDLRDTMTQYIQ